MPTVSPLGPTRRTSGTRIRSLIRSSVLMCPPGGNSAGVLVVRRPRGSETTKGFRLLQAEASPTPPTRGSRHLGRRHGEYVVHTEAGAFRTGTRRPVELTHCWGGRCGWEAIVRASACGSVPPWVRRDRSVNKEC